MHCSRRNTSQAPVTDVRFIDLLPTPARTYFKQNNKKNRTELLYFYCYIKQLQTMLYLYSVAAYLTVKLGFENEKFPWNMSFFLLQNAL